MEINEFVSNVLNSSPDFKISKTEIKKSTGKISRVLLESGQITPFSEYSRKAVLFIDENLQSATNFKLFQFIGKMYKLKAAIENYVYSCEAGDVSDFDPDKSEARNALGGAKLYVDMLTSETKVLQGETLMPFSGDMYIGTMGIKKEEVFLHAEPVKLVYAPRIKDRFFNARVTGFTAQAKHLNLFVSQDWLQVPMEEALKFGPPREFIELLEHLFPLDADRDFVIHWLYRSLVARARTFLILCGDPGVGKTTLKEVFKGVHGPENTGDGKKSTVSGQFNSQLARGTLLWFDELRYGETEENFMKEMPNDTMAIEFKGQDINTSTDIHNSYVISNNKPRDNYIAMDSRKFCPVKITKTRLDKIWSPEKIDTFKAKFNSKDSRYDVKYIAQIGYWIMLEGPKHFGKYINDEYESPKLYELRHTSLSRWKKRLSDVIHIMDDRGISLGEIPKISSDTFDKYRISTFRYVDLEEWWSKYNNKIKSKVTLPEESTVESFLTIYRDMQGKKICEVEEIAGDIIFRKLGQSSKPHDFEEETDFENFDDIAIPANKVDSSDNYNDIL